MTVHEFQDIIISFWEGGVETSQRVPDPREVSIVGAAAMEELIYENIRENMTVDSSFYSTPDVLTVQTNTQRNKRYTTLTSKPLLSPQGQSLILISPVQNDSIQFIEKTAMSNFIFKGLEAEKLFNQTSFTLENKTVIYDNLPPEYSSVLVKIVKSISDMEEDETIPCPNHLLNRVLDLTLQKFGLQQQQAKNIFVQQKSE